MTTHFTSASISGRAFSMAPDYASMADWELEQLSSGYWTAPFFLAAPEALADELSKRHHAKTMANEWRQLERHGFGM